MREICFAREITNVNGKSNSGGARREKESDKRVRGERDKMFSCTHAFVYKRAKLYHTVSACI